LRRINPLFPPLTEKEVRKFFDAKIIVSLMISKCLANLVSDIKKNEEIRICIDFKNLNRVSYKDNYPFPKMNDFSGYNQIMVHPDNQEKTKFTTPWGTFMYAKIPFRSSMQGKHSIGIWI
jgi:hypothetical protein